MREYIIACHVPICPNCGGALDNKIDPMVYACNDCDSAYVVAGPGQAEHEMKCFRYTPKDLEEIKEQALS